MESRLFSGRHFSYGHLAGALIAGLALRLFFILHFPFYSGDTKFYEELARNWLYHGVYGLFVNGQLLPVDMRMPGYPVFLAAIYRLFGDSRMAVMLLQAVADLGTCVLAALIASRLAPFSHRKWVANCALWIAALCPFTADYTAAILTETIATFLTTFAILVFVVILSDESTNVPLRELNSKALLARAGGWLLGGLLVGIATLVRPEAPLLLAAVGIALLLRWRRGADWPKLAFAALCMAAGLLLPLVPWATRNAVTLGRIQFFAPRYAESYGDFIPRGFFAWTRTWMVRFGDSYLVPWKLGNEPIAIGSLPAYAFDSDSERIKVARLLASYNTDLKMSPMLDREFAALAAERTARHPFRTYLTVPIERAWLTWFTPRMELLPYSAGISALNKQDPDAETGVLVTVGYTALNLILVALAIVGIWLARGHPAWLFLVSFFLVRTAAVTQLQTMEPRYVIECYPELFAFASLSAGYLWSLFAARELAPDVRPIILEGVAGHPSVKPFQRS
jgi:4-amino-4-deoxy-L-arabinose transferase-like glycosyltransferase